MYLRQMEIVTDVDKLQVDLQETFMKYKTIKQWAYIIHDKDDTRPHYHIYLHFGTSTVNTADVAKWFNVPENFINKVKGRKTDMLMYLTHANDTQKNKHQYSPSEVVANFDFETEIANSKIIGDFKNYSYAQQLTYVNSLPIVEKVKAFSQLEKLWKIECQYQSMVTDRDLQVIFITGKGGCGKTYYAKKLLNELNYDFCVSSSSNDPFQDYMGQKAIILDDLRDSSFSLADLLKILDNNTNSSVKSRFNNKVFNGSMIIITSSVPLHYWYINLKYDDNEDLNQLYRRISTYIWITKDVIRVYDEGVNEVGGVKGKANEFINTIVTSNDVKKERKNISDIFGKLEDSDLPF